MASIILAICLGLLLTALIVWFENKIHRTYLTPSVLLFVPFVGVCLVWLLVGHPLGFVSPSAGSILFSELCFFLFWVGGVFTTLACYKGYRGVRGPAISKRELVWTKRFAFLVVLILIGGLAFYLVELGGISAWGTTAIEETYGRGLTGHIRIWSFIPFIVLCSYLDRRDYWGWIICAGLLLCYFAYPVKSWVILPLVSSVIGRHLVFKWRPKAKTVLWVALAGYVIFVASYAVAFWAQQGTLDWAYTLRLLNYHFLTYLFSGLLAFGQVYENYEPPLYAQEPAALFSSIVNIYHVYTREPLLSPVNQYFVVIHPDLGKTVNVYTLFGSIWFHLGTGYTLVFAFVLGILIYLLFKIAVVINSPYLFAASCFWSSALVLGWFEYYFWHLPFIELLVVAILIEVVRRLRWGRSREPGGDIRRLQLRRRTRSEDSLSCRVQLHTHRTLG